MHEKSCIPLRLCGNGKKVKRNRKEPLASKKLSCSAMLCGILISLTLLSGKNNKI
jgi:hypothetical protein